jgi:hypothetical protein
MMVILTSMLGPTLLAAGQDIDGCTFSGSKSDAMVVLALFGALGAFGGGGDGRGRLPAALWSTELAPVRRYARRTGR